MENLTPHFRERSGRVANLNAFDLFLINVFGYSLGVSLTTNPVIIGGFAPSANIYLVLVFGLVAALFNGLSYGLFAEIMPSAVGGDYTYVTHTLGRWAGFCASVGFTAAQIYGLSLNATWAVTQAAAPGFSTYGVLTNNKHLIQLATKLVESKIALEISVIYICILLLIAIGGLRISKWIFICMFVIAFGGTVIQGLAFYHIDHSAFVALYDQFVQHTGSGMHSYAEVVSIGRSNSHAFDQSRVLRDSLKAAPIGFLIFFGFTYSAYMGGEVKMSGRPQMVGIMSALALGALCFFAIMGRYFHVVGQEFNSSLALDAVKNSMPAGTSSTFFAGLIIKNRWLNLWMNIGNVVWFALVPLVMLHVCTRIVQGWTARNMLPAWLESYKVAAFFVALATIAVSFLSYEISYTLIAAIALIAVSAMLVGISAILYTTRHKAEFKATLPLARRHVMGIPFLSIIGFGSIICFLGIVGASLRYPIVFGIGTDRRVWYLSLGVYLSASVYFFFRERFIDRNLKLKGITLDEIQKELPTD